MFRLSTCGGFALLAVTVAAVVILAAGGGDRPWGPVCIALLGILGVVAGLVAVEDILLRRRRCPRCEAQGFEAVHESERITTVGSDGFSVFRCEHCGLHLLECGDEATELDPERWEEGMEAWLKK